MATICSALNTPFTPAAGLFRVTVVDGSVVLMAKGDASATKYGVVGRIEKGTVADVSNPSGDSVYQFLGVSESPQVIATQ
ncbi:MAG: hypothetical protein ACRDAM_17185 [Casimicrobium sp.]